MPREKLTVRDEQELVDRILEKIDAHLERRIPGPEIAKWAVHELYENKAHEGDYLIAAALRALIYPAYVLAPGAFDEGLREIRAALVGEGVYVVKMARIPEEKLRSQLPATSFAPMEADPPER